jgi:hypothetical protein
MAKVHLQGNRLDDERDLPNVCMRCGADATNHKRKQFSWYPPWISVTVIASPIITIILAAILTKRRTVAVPFCDRHRSHWLMRGLLILFTLLGLIVVGVASYFIADAASTYNSDTPGIVCFLTFAVGFLAWLILVVIVQQGAIRPTKIDDYEMTLTNVSAEFADAYEQELDQRRGDRRVDRAVRERWDDRRGGRDYDDRDRGRPRDEEERGRGRYREHEEDSPRRPRGYEHEDDSPRRPRGYEDEDDRPRRRPEGYRE